MAARPEWCWVEKGLATFKNKKFGTDVALGISDIDIFFQTSYGCKS